MLHILLLLLKIIGGLILALLCLVLVGLTVVLLVPVRYRICASKYTAIEAEGQVSWLCHLIGFFFRLDTGKEEDQRIHMRLRIACFCIYDNLRPKKERIKKERVRKTKNKKDKKPDNEVSQTADEIRSDSETGEEKSLTKLESGNKKPEHRETAEKSDGSSEESRDAVPEKKKCLSLKGLWEKLTGVFQRMVSIPSAISQRVYDTTEKLDAVNKKKDKLMAIYHDEKNHRWLTMFLTRLKRLAIRLLPKIDRLFWHFGFSDPATTGQVLGMLSVFYPLCMDRMMLQPEFGQEAMEGEIALHGSIRMLPFAVFAVRSFLNKQFFSIVKQVKNI